MTPKNEFSDGASFPSLEKILICLYAIWSPIYLGKPHKNFFTQNLAKLLQI